MNFIKKFHSWRRKIRWNKQYRRGRWNNLKSDLEKIRYQTIIDFISTYAVHKPSILDLGCGEGILCERMDPHFYSTFVGLDFSSVSIKNAARLNLPNTTFICADIHSYVPDKKFDVIVFNEVFYYIHKSEKDNVLKRMIASLNPNGIIITSNYREGRGSWKYFEEKMTQLQFTTITTDKDNTYWKIGAYKK